VKKRKEKGKGRGRKERWRRRKRSSSRIGVQETKEEENKGAEEQGGRDKTRAHTK